MTIRDPRHLWAGILFVAIGLGAVVQASAYEFGTATEMGPGFFPAMVGGLLSLLGLLAIRRGVAADEPVAMGAWPLLPLARVLAGVVAFALLIRPFGLAPALTALILLACSQRLRAHPLEIIAITVILIGVATLVFIHGVQLNLQLLNWGG